jgi:hypothetical protein
MKVAENITSVSWSELSLERKAAYAMDVYDIVWGTDIEGRGVVISKG